MTRKINLFYVSVLSVVFFASQAFAQPQQTTLSIRAIDVDSPMTVFLGQSEPVEHQHHNHNKVTLADRFKRFFANLTRDEDASAPESPQESVRTTPSSVPTRPPKPPTAEEVRQAVENPNQAIATERHSNIGRRHETPISAVNSGSSRNTNTSPDDEDDETQGESIFIRMAKMRTRVFDKQPINENIYREMYTVPTPVRTNPATANSVSPVRTPQTDTVRSARASQQIPPLTPPISTPDETVDNTETTSQTEPQPLSQPRSVRDRVMERTDKPITNRPLVDASAPRSVLPENQQPVQPVPPVQTVQASPSGSQPPINRTEDDEHVPQVVEYTSAMKRLLSGEHQELNTGLQESVRTNGVTEQREKKLLVSPQLEVETEGEPRAIVGQEAVYQIRIVNRGDVFAEQVVLSVEIPHWLEIAQPEVSAGTTSVVPRDGNKELRDFVWKISRVDAKSQELLVLHLIPQQRKTVDLRIKYDFFRPATIAKIDVQEPILNMELQGPDEVLWGCKVGYKLLVRNTGNGDAENVKLELLQTGSDMKSCELLILKAGEEQVIDVDVWTGKQEYIDINIQATGMYGLSEKANKRVKVMRPNIVMAVDSPTVQFVGNPAEFQIKVQNVGNAAARDIVLAAVIPLGAEFISCTAGGELTPENQLVWKIDSILVGDVFTASVICKPKREGDCKLETSLGDRSGELANCVGSFEAEAIIELKLDVEIPQGPIEVGQETVYTLNITNRGTKAAENVEVRTAFGKGLEPFAVEGGVANQSDGQVVFDKIPTITVGQNLILKVKAKAEEPGNLKVRSEVICSAANISLANEGTTYFYKKQKGKSTTVVSSEPSSTPTQSEKAESEDPFLQ
jgi:uncharacterized repeat protein (TIGR01451 family)